MKVVPFQVPQTSKEAFRLQTDSLPHFYDQLHQHPEIQIMWILKSEGTLIANDYVGRFRPGDLFIIGSHQPHVFRNDDYFYENRHDNHAAAISLYFDRGYMGDHFWNLDEVKSIQRFLDSTSQCFLVHGRTRHQVTTLMQDLIGASGVGKLIGFLEILKVLSTSTELKGLCFAGRQASELPDTEGQRMNDILQFTFSESHRKIYLSEVAQVANLSVEAFCRYFKLRTQKTYTNFLNEVRISNACKLLIRADHTMQDVCYKTGFNNISNFNRIFKKVTGKTPTAYLRG
ncbi:MAG: AraC family transcriptional regulator [Bacteroidia bacterium]|nr:AraC family transcriptional regulator [Bacteroidia bacterium]